MKVKLTKDENFFNIYNAVLKAEVEKGHLNWRISDIARSSGVSRPLIYHYFGKEKELLLTEASKFMIESIFFINKKEVLQVKEVLKKALIQIKKMPYLFVLFFLEKDQNSNLGKIIREAESKLFQTLLESNPDLSHQDILKIYILELGIITHKNLEEEQVNSLLDFS